MVFCAKIFPELSGTEVYEILKSRSEVFLMEQNIVCLDADGKDYESLHCFLLYLLSKFQITIQGIF